MAKKSMIEKNEFRKRFVARKKASRQALKDVIHDKETPMEERFAAVLKLAQIPRNSSPVRVRNRCVLTGRPRGTYRKFKLSRIALRELASSGQLPGMIKSSW